MMRFIFQRESVPVLDAALSFAHQRHQTIMNNIANVETPYYKRQAVPEGQFHDSMKRALRERRRSHPNQFRMQDTKDIRFGPAGVRSHVQRRPGQEYGPMRHDENSVVIEKEMSDLAKNTIYTQTLQQLLRKKYTMLRASLRDRVA
jgi:flagellar basal-body rod protein FlgB